MGGFSNNALSGVCHVNQHAPAEIVFFTRKPESGPDPVMMFRFTITRAIMGGGGYGVYKNLYLDSDPILVSGVGRIHQSRPDKNWLKSIEPGLTSSINRMLNSIGKEGLVVCKDLSGNSGSYRWSTNCLDVVGFGHIDAYTNAWVYRAMKNASTLYTELGNPVLSKKCSEAAIRIKEAYATHLLNPETGMVAGWLSRDGKLHDYAFIWVNGVACAFGLLTDEQAINALRKLENLRSESFVRHALFGLSLNLKPIPETDHLLPQLWGKLKFTSTFGQYSDGAMSHILIQFYIRALARYGFAKECEQMITELEQAYVKGTLNGGLDSGVEIYTWEGIPSGYEGTFVDSFAALYPIAVHRGLIQAPNPEWWI